MPDAARRTRVRAKSPERSVQRVSFGNVAGDRFLWCVEFAGDYPTADSNLILYLDADNNPQTGRKDMPGVDYMLGFSAGRGSMSVISPTGQCSSGPPLHTYLAGKRLYLCPTCHCTKSTGNRYFRTNVLSERRKPARGESTGWFLVKGGAESPPAKSPSASTVASPAKAWT